MYFYKSLVFNIVFLSLLLVWFLGSVWALLFGMTVSATAGLLGTPFLFQPWLPKPFSLRQMITAAVIIPTFMWHVGWSEYRTQSIRYNCTAYQIYFTIRSDIPTWCPNNYRVPLDTYKYKRLYLPSQRVGIRIHHFVETLLLNIQGFHWQAEQRRKMISASLPFPNISSRPLREKRSICNSSGQVTGTTNKYQTNILLQHSNVQQTLFEHQDTIANLKQWESFSSKISPKANPKNDTESLIHSNAKLLLTFTRNTRTWKITQAVVYTPKSAVWITIPTLFKQKSIPISKAMYCGLQMEGVLSPYLEEWAWTETVDTKPQDLSDILAKQIE